MRWIYIYIRYVVYRLDKDQCIRKLARDTFHINDPDYYEFEGRIVVTSFPLLLFHTVYALTSNLNLKHFYATKSRVGLQLTFNPHTLTCNNI